MTLTVSLADESDAGAVALLRVAAAERLTRDYGAGHWSTGATQVGVIRAMRGSRILVAREDDTVIGTVRLAGKRPWAIDPAPFTRVARPLYLVDMAVAPERQRQGIGRRLLAEAIAVAVAWPSEAVRLDAYDAPAGAGGFYARCGWREVGRARFRGTSLIYFELLL